MRKWLTGVVEVTIHICVPGQLSHGSGISDDMSGVALDILQEEGTKGTKQGVGVLTLTPSYSGDNCSSSSSDSDALSAGELESDGDEAKDSKAETANTGSSRALVETGVATGMSGIAIEVRVPVSVSVMVFSPLCFTECRVARHHEAAWVQHGSGGLSCGITALLKPNGSLGFWFLGCAFCVLGLHMRSRLHPHGRM